MIAISIKTFNRPHRIRACVAAIQSHCRVPYRLYVADDGDRTDEITSLYDGLQKDGHVIKTYTQKVNVTKARNDLLSLMDDESYVLRMDDDFMFTPETDISAMIAILDDKKNIGAISDLERQSGDGKKLKSGEISSGQGFIVRDGDIYRKITLPVENWVWSYSGGLRFCYANFTRNFVLIRREVFASVKWNEDIIIHGEHEAFMLDLQKAGWALAFTPESVHIHDETGDKPSAEYKKFRRSLEAENRIYEIYKNEYGINNIETSQLAGLLGLEKIHKKSRQPAGLIFRIKKRIFNILNQLNK